MPFLALPYKVNPILIPFYGTNSRLSNSCYQDPRAARLKEVCEPKGVPWLTMFDAMGFITNPNAMGAVVDGAPYPFR